jgi:hypothetical protein
MTFDPWVYILDASRSGRLALRQSTNDWAVDGTPLDPETQDVTSALVQFGLVTTWQVRP